MMEFMNMFRRNPNHFLRHDRVYGESLRDDPMIKDIASKLFTGFEKEIKDQIFRLSSNHGEIEVYFNIYGENIDSFQTGSIAYKNYGYAPIKNISKKRGIAWILQDIVSCALKERFPECKRIRTSYRARGYNYWNPIVIFKLDVELDKYKKF